MALEAPRAAEGPSIPEGGSRVSINGSRAAMTIRERGRILSLSERVDPGHTALVVIDVQNDFCHPNGITGRQGNDLAVMESMAARIRDVLVETRRLGLLTVFVRGHEDARYLHDPMAETYLRRDLAEGLVQKGSWAADWFGDIKPISAANEIDFIKHRFSAFADSPLDLYLRSNGIQTIVFTGVVTSGCVDCSVRDGYSLGYHCVVLADAVADSSLERHEASLRKLAQAFGTVTQSKDILEAWRGRNAPSRNWTDATKRSTTPTTLADQFSPSRTAVLLMGNAPDGRTDRKPHAELDRLAAAARRAGVFIVHVVPDRHPLSRSGAALEREGLRSLPATGEAMGTPVVRPQPLEEIVNSHRYGAFTGTRLDSLLRANQVRSVVIAGAGLATAIETTAREASDRDLQVTVVRDAIIDSDATGEQAQHSLSIIGQHFGRVASANEIVDVWHGEKVAGPI